MAGGTTVPLEIDATAPTTARMYDFWLGGHDNFAVNRAAAPAVSEAVPEIGLMALENREFLRRAIRYLAGEAGIAQFPDIGTWLPTHRNVHHVVQQVNPDARVVYVDNNAKSRFSVLSGASLLGPARDRRHGRRTRARGNLASAMTMPDAIPQRDTDGSSQGTGRAQECLRCVE